MNTEDLSGHTDSRVLISSTHGVQVDLMRLSIEVLSPEIRIGTCVCGTKTLRFP